MLTYINTACISVAIINILIIVILLLLITLECLVNNWVLAIINILSVLSVFNYIINQTGYFLKTYNLIILSILSLVFDLHHID